MHMKRWRRCVAAGGGHRIVAVSPVMVEIVEKGAAVCWRWCVGRLANVRGSMARMGGRCVAVAGRRDWWRSQRCGAGGVRMRRCGRRVQLIRCSDSGRFEFIVPTVAEEVRQIGIHSSEWRTDGWEIETGMAGVLGKAARAALRWGSSVL